MKLYNQNGKLIAKGDFNFSSVTELKIEEREYPEEFLVITFSFSGENLHTYKKVYLQSLFACIVFSNDYSIQTYDIQGDTGEDELQVTFSQQEKQKIPVFLLKRFIENK